MVFPVSSSVGDAIEKVFTRNSDKKIWAELTVSINTILDNNAYGDIEHFKEPKIIISSNKYHDILNLIVSTLFIKEKNLKFYLLAALQENTTVKNHPELVSLIQHEALLKIFLVEQVNRRGFSYLFSIINFKVERNNKKCISTLIRIKKNNLGTQRRYIPEVNRIGVGYRDKGSLPDLSSENPNKYINQTQLQLEIEERRKTKEDTAQFIVGLLE